MGMEYSPKRIQRIKAAQRKARDAQTHTVAQHAGQDRKRPKGTFTPEYEAWLQRQRDKNRRRRG